MLAPHDGKLTLTHGAAVDEIHADERRRRLAQSVAIVVGDAGGARQGILQLEAAAGAQAAVAVDAGHGRRRLLDGRRPERRLAPRQFRHGGKQGVDPRLFLVRRRRVQLHRFGIFFEIERVGRFQVVAFQHLQEGDVESGP